MEFEIKGNYFNNQYHLPKTSGANRVDRVIKRECPSDISLTLWELPVDYTHVEPTIESAKKGFTAMRKLPLEERINLLKRYQENVLSKKEEIARAISLESGKPIWEAQGEVNSVVGKVDVTIDASLPRISDTSIEEVMPNTRGHVYNRPIGPCLIIGPFNYPCHLANTQILSALIAGNSIIFKPSEKTTYSGQLMFDCLIEAGFPEGAVNLVQGDGEIAGRLVKEKAIKGVFFTGSKEVGKRILKATSNDISKLVALELGGKNSAIVCEDANYEFTLEEMLKACFLTTGQRCVSVSNIIMHRSLIDRFVKDFHELAKKIIIDHPIDHEVAPFMGPLVDQRALDSYLLFMGMAKREGLEEIMRGKQIQKNKKGYYVTPSIHLAKEFNKESHFLTSEVFGPNATFIPFDTLDEAIEIANATEYGLASCIFTKDRSNYERAIQEIDAGLVNLNRSTCGASAKLPFGGVKNSGNYRPAAVSMIDSCVYQMTSLEVLNDTPEGLDKIKGLDL